MVWDYADSTGKILVRYTWYIYTSYIVYILYTNSTWCFYFVYAAVEKLFALYFLYESHPGVKNAAKPSTAQDRRQEGGRDYGPFSDRRPGEGGRKGGRETKRLGFVAITRSTAASRHQSCTRKCDDGLID